MFGGNEYYCGEMVTTIPEISKDLEFGIEYDNSKLNFNVNAFYMWFKNELVLNGEVGPNGLPCHENADKSFRRGVELTAKWNIFSKLFYTINGSLSENKVKSKTFGDKTHILSPSATMFSELSWNDKKWEVGASVTYRNKMYIDMNNEYTLPSSISYDAYVKMFLNKFEICVLFDGIGSKDDLDFCTAMVGADGELLYVQSAPFSINCSLKYFF
jgi:iron complex outermembrane receptor protein